jgi:hypothetical protein
MKARNLIFYGSFRDIMNKFDIEFLNGYIKSSLRLARKIKGVKTLDEAKKIALEIEEKAMKKLEETMGNL